MEEVVSAFLEEVVSAFFFPGPCQCLLMATQVRGGRRRGRNREVTGKIMCDLRVYYQKRTDGLFHGAIGRVP